MTTPAHADNDESQAARWQPLPRHRSHPLSCLCRDCLVEQWDPAEEES